ncbi:MAG: hypothetical protein JKY33_08190 [Bacteroidia bacterium]|nr:hypothetical protein [Bacteroidia bacterium]
MIKSLNKELLVLFFAAFLFACSGGGSQDQSQLDDEMEGISFEEVDKETQEKVKTIIYSIPSPIQIASLIKNSGANYNGEVLNPASNVENYYSTNSSIALNLGVYGADLGYCCMYDKTQDAISYLTATKKLSDALGILGAFEVATMERFEENLDNKDSLIHIVSESFRMSDTYLKENERNSLGALVLTGGWLEGLYLSAKIVELHPLQPIITRIGEQKKSLGNLILLLKQFEAEKQIPDLIISLEELQKEFDNVEIKETYAPPTTDPNTGVTTINSKSEVIISKESLETIIKKIETIRNDIIS